MSLHVDHSTAQTPLNSLLTTQLTTDCQHCVDAERAAAVFAYKADWLAASHRIQYQANIRDGPNQEKGEIKTNRLKSVSSLQS